MCQVSADRPGSFTNKGFSSGSSVNLNDELGSINFFGVDFPQRACASGTLTFALPTQDVDRGDMLFTIGTPPASSPDV